MEDNVKFLKKIRPNLKSCNFGTKNHGFYQFKCLLIVKVFLVKFTNLNVYQFNDRINFMKTSIILHN
jgi:hypothetical protein